MTKKSPSSDELAAILAMDDTEAIRVLTRLSVLLQEEHAASREEALEFYRRVAAINCAINALLRRNTSPPSAVVSAAICLEERKRLAQFFAERRGTVWTNDDVVDVILSDLKAGNGSGR